jgi:hypothetical protein
MCSCRVVIVKVGTQCFFEVAFIDDNNVVQAFASDGTYNSMFELISNNILIIQSFPQGVQFLGSGFILEALSEPYIYYQIEKHPIRC